jgi:hypothetical protein
MKGECYTYDVGAKLDLQKLSKKAPALKWLDKEQTLLFSDIGNMKALVYSDGRIRIHLPEKPFEEVREHLLSASAEVYALIEEIKKATGIKTSTKDIIGSGVQEVISGFDPEVRKSLGIDVTVNALRSMMFSMYDIAGDFQAERIATQAGEILGRKFVSKTDFKNTDQLIKGMVEYFLENKLGKLVNVSKAEEMKGVPRDATLRVYECAFCAGMPPVNRHVCNFDRGFLRGAFAVWKNTETVTVKETRCWGMGDSFCEFDIYTLSR